MYNDAERQRLASINHNVILPEIIRPYEHGQYASLTRAIEHLLNIGFPMSQHTYSALNFMTGTPLKVDALRQIMDDRVPHGKLKILRPNLPIPEEGLYGARTVALQKAQYAHARTGQPSIGADETHARFHPARGWETHHQYARLGRPLTPDEEKSNEQEFADTFVAGTRRQEQDRNSHAMVAWHPTVAMQNGRSDVNSVVVFARVRHMDPEIAKAYHQRARETGMLYNTGTHGDFAETITNERLVSQLAFVPHAYYLRHKHENGFLQPWWQEVTQQSRGLRRVLKRTAASTLPVVGLGMRWGGTNVAPESPVAVDA